MLVNAQNEVTVLWLAGSSLPALTSLAVSVPKMAEMGYLITASLAQLSIALSGFGTLAHDKQTAG
jgi:hypothetical protein